MLSYSPFTRILILPSEEKAAKGSGIEWATFPIRDSVLFLPMQISYKYGFPHLLDIKQSSKKDEEGHYHNAFYPLVTQWSCQLK